MNFLILNKPGEHVTEKLLECGHSVTKDLTRQQLAKSKIVFTDAIINLPESDNDFAYFYLLLAQHIKVHIVDRNCVRMPTEIFHLQEFECFKLLINVYSTFENFLKRNFI